MPELHLLKMLFGMKIVSNISTKVVNGTTNLNEMVNIICFYVVCTMYIHKQNFYLETLSYRKQIVVLLPLYPTSEYQELHQIKGRIQAQLHPLTYYLLIINHVICQRCERILPPSLIFCPWGRSEKKGGGEKQ